MARRASGLEDTTARRDPHYERWYGPVSGALPRLRRLFVVRVPAIARVGRTLVRGAVAELILDIMAGARWREGLRRFQPVSDLLGDGFPRNHAIAGRPCLVRGRAPLHRRHFLRESECQGEFRHELSVVGDALCTDRGAARRGAAHHLDRACRRGALVASVRAGALP